VHSTVYSSDVPSEPALPAQEPRAADRIYTRVKTMAVTFHFRPGERINEVERPGASAPAARRCARH
jgi:hypothetical protein